MEPERGSRAMSIRYYVLTFLTPGFLFEYEAVGNPGSLEEGGWAVVPEGHRSDCPIGNGLPPVCTMQNSTSVRVRVRGDRTGSDLRTVVVGSSAVKRPGSVDMGIIYPAVRRAQGKFGVG